MMRSFGAAITLICACATAVLAPGPAAHAQLDGSLLREASELAESGGDDEYAQVVERVISSELGIPQLVVDGLNARDVPLILYGVDLIESTDRQLYQRADLALEVEQSMLPDNGDLNPPDVAFPPPENRAESHEIDQKGAALLEHMDFRELEVPADVRIGLQVMPDPGTGTRPPRPVTFERGRRQLQELLAASASASASASDEARSATDEPTASSQTGSFPGWLSIITTTALAVGLLAFVRFRRRTHHQLVQLAMTDGLTGLKNRRQLDNDLSSQVAGGERPTAMLMVDVDNFKQFNDAHGHAAGDDVLRMVGHAIATHVRLDDVPYRYGGEEFCVLLPDTDIDEARTVAERVRRAIAMIETPFDASVTASVGVASGPSATIATTAGAADAALFSAKHHGRNQVAIGSG